MIPRTLAKNFLCKMLESQVVRLRRKHPFKVIVVSGSIGKTSTKLAIAGTLRSSLRVQYQQGNYNDRLTVPLVVFGQTLPALTNVVGWVRILLANERTIRSAYPYDIAVLELGADGPGQLKVFDYLQPDISVVTAITPEHMEFFKDMDAVAAEELTPLGFSKKAFINIDDSPAKYLDGRNYTSYGFSEGANYKIASAQLKSLAGGVVDLAYEGGGMMVTTPFLGTAGAKITAAAFAVARECGLEDAAITSAIATLPLPAGRMQLLTGKKGSVLIDDTYNATPAAVKAGLDVLYAAEGNQKIAILGSMNELGDYAPEAHKEVGQYCDPGKLQLVVTIGRDAEQYLAPEAKAKGCNVASFKSPYDAGAYVLEQLQDSAVVLGEGSQNGVFAEEALKQLLENPADAAKLVRQSAGWMDAKKQQFLSDKQ